MALQIDVIDRIANKQPPKDPNDITELNADRVMAMLDRIVNGDYRVRMPRWTVATRPASPEVGEFGLNTEINQREWWDGSEWRQD